jgi:hypothetical protein
MAKKRKLRKLGLLNPPRPSVKVVEEVEPVVEEKAEPVVEEKKPSRKKRKGLFSKKKDD